MRCSSLARSFTLLIGAACFAPLAAQSQGHSYAIVIGVDNYSFASLPKLAYAAGDARALGDYLRSQGFEVISLYNQQATKQAILEAMQNRLAPRLRPEDRILFFFAGHGYTETLNGQDRGYIIPYDGGAASASFISVAELQEQSSNMGAARHQLFLMDSCFGGQMATRGVALSPSMPNYLAEVSSRVARQVLTAGGKNQEVLDGGPEGHSPFVSALLSGLANGKADLNGDGYITFNELSAYVLSAGSTRFSTPAESTLPGHQGGEFLFRATVGLPAEGVNPSAPSQRLAGPQMRVAVSSPASINLSMSRPPGGAAATPSLEASPGEAAIKDWKTDVYGHHFTVLDGDWTARVESGRAVMTLTNEKANYQIELYCERGRLWNVLEQGGLHKQANGTWGGTEIANMRDRVNYWRAGGKEQWAWFGAVNGGWLQRNVPGQRFNNSPSLSDGSGTLPDDLVERFEQFHIAQAASAVLSAARAYARSHAITWDLDTIFSGLSEIGVAIAAPSNPNRRKQM